jgi:hypothetical protein
MSTLVVGVIAAGCQLATIVDRDLIDGAGGAGGQGGSGPECTVAADCLGNNTACSIRSCNSGACGIELTAEGTPCTDDGGAVCDGDGKCVECIDDNQCLGADKCELETNTCSQSQCNDATLNGTETDVDCGGPECAPCGNGSDCSAPTDCESAFCDGGTCAACAGDVDCETGTYCDPTLMACLSKKSNGDPCTLANECGNNSCADGVCCESACQSVCQTCATTGMEGTCLPHPPGMDPDSECGADVCSGAASCRCGNSVKDGSETDIDCGGGTCTGCASGETCAVAGDCQSNQCLGNLTCQ